MKELWQLFITFLKIGTATFGGGYAMIPAIRRETVEKRHWIDEDGIADCIAISQSLPSLCRQCFYFHRGKSEGNAGSSGGLFWDCISCIFGYSHHLNVWER